jgi:hypothetical protein
MFPQFLCRMTIFLGHKILGKIVSLFLLKGSKLMEIQQVLKLSLTTPEEELYRWQWMSWRLFRVLLTGTMLIFLVICVKPMSHMGNLSIPVIWSFTTKVGAFLFLWDLTFYLIKRVFLNNGNNFWLECDVLMNIWSCLSKLSFWRRVQNVGSRFLIPTGPIFGRGRFKPGWIKFFPIVFLGETLCLTPHLCPIFSPLAPAQLTNNLMPLCILWSNWQRSMPNQLAPCQGCCFCIRIKLMILLGIMPDATLGRKT